MGSDNFRQFCLNCAALLAFSSIATARAWAQQHASPVPPELEIEVIDPGADPLGNPAVELVPDPNHPGQQRVEIPPTVMVHRYYYSGDRTFQGPMLPGGPSVLVMNHPKTGERCYVSAQMLPGAPKVTYRSRSIEYNYGESGITVVFGLFGPPTLKYRSGRTWSQKAADLVHVEKLKSHWHTVKVHTHTAAQRSKAATTGLIVEIHDQAKIVTLPAQNIVRMMPFGAALTSGSLGPQLAERAAEHKRAHQAQKAEHDQAWQQLDCE
jgi:hypothetical protein